MMDIKEITYKLLAERLISNFESKRLVKWAVTLLENGYESESIVTLAGLDFDSKEEREKYFWKSIEELDIEIDRNDFELVEDYALGILRHVIDKKVNPKEGLRIIKDVMIHLEYTSKFTYFFELVDAIDDFESGYEAYSYPDLTFQNQDQFIYGEIMLFMELEKLEMTGNIKEFVNCLRCNTFTKSEWIKKKYFWKTRKISNCVCSNCKSEDIEHIFTQESRKRLVEMLKMN